MMHKIDNFRGKYRFLSNFYPCQIIFDGVTYPSIEHAFQASKTFNLNERKLILMCKNPLEAKQMGKSVTLRPDWENIKFEVMSSLLRQKFAHGHLHVLLLKTKGSILIEGNTWGDKVWGCVQYDGRWKGKNMLGQLLMKLRDELLRNKDTSSMNNA